MHHRSVKTQTQNEEAREQMAGQTFIFSFFICGHTDAALLNVNSLTSQGLSFTAVNALETRPSSIYGAHNKQTNCSTSSWVDKCSAVRPLLHAAGSTAHSDQERAADHQHQDPPRQIAPAPESRRRQPISNGAKRSDASQCRASIDRSLMPRPGRQE